MPLLVFVVISGRETQDIKSPHTPRKTSKPQRSLHKTCAKNEQQQQQLRRRQCKRHLRSRSSSRRCCFVRSLALVPSSTQRHRSSSSSRRWESVPELSTFWSLVVCGSLKRSNARSYGLVRCARSRSFRLRVHSALTVRTCVCVCLCACFIAARASRLLLQQPHKSKVENKSVRKSK